MKSNRFAVISDKEDLEKNKNKLFLGDARKRGNPVLVTIICKNNNLRDRLQIIGKFAV